ncbi:TBC1 domain family member 14 [Planoprotostelium fungivorum]|uniref:TBC1 domain family member 14 n=1 Tax=Planoprotostelium fungivorum TaxID=1890364 RepID=A0A2P6MRE0_9EUKA|nr:TBC1 domain family member 14 [Planoprotostelium fungivorum]
MHCLFPLTFGSDLMGNQQGTHGHQRPPLDEDGTQYTAISITKTASAYDVHARKKTQSVYRAPDNLIEEELEVTQRRYIRSSTLSSLRKSAEGQSREDWKARQREEVDLDNLLRMPRVLPLLEGTEMMKPPPPPNAPVRPLGDSFTLLFVSPSAEFLDTRSILSMATEYHIIMQHEIKKITETQQTSITKIVEVEKRATRALTLTKERCNDVRSFQKAMSEIDKMSLTIERVRSELMDLIAKMEYFNDMVPEDMRESIHQSCTSDCAMCTNRSQRMTPMTPRVKTLNRSTSGLSSPPTSPTKVRGFSITGRKKNKNNRSSIGEHSEKRPLTLAEGLNRSEEWVVRIGNMLQINSETYLRLVETLDQRRYSSLTIQRSVAQSQPLSEEEEFRQLSRLIKLDVPRTFFPGVEFGTERPFERFGNPMTYGDFCDSTTRLLEIPSSQGMSYVASMLLIFLNQSDAFISFANLLENHFFSSIFRMDMAKHFTLYELIFSQNLPSLYEHFRGFSITPDQYLLSWLSTIFCKVLPLPLCCRVWDRFLEYGELYLLQTAIGILRLFNSRLVRFTFEEIVDFLKNLPLEGLSEDDFLESINSVITPFYASRIVDKLSAIK